jgi:hypothetical protein
MFFNPRELTIIVAALVGATVIPTASVAADPQPPVAFAFIGLRGGGWYTFPSSNAAGSTVVDTEAAAWSRIAFQTASQSLVAPEPNTPDVYITYGCTYWTPTGEQTAEGDSNSNCGDPDAEYVQSLHAKLNGSDASKYHLAYFCWYSQFGHPDKRQQLGPFYNGETCGYVQKDYWLSRIKIWICPASDIPCANPTP